jgi:FkbM family methyltransferase
MVFEDNLYGLHDFTGATVIDLGAHIGSFTNKVLDLGAAEVLSVEPNPANFAILEQNTLHEPAVRRYLAALDYGGSVLVAISAVDTTNTGRVYSGDDAVSRASYFVPQMRLETLLDLLPSGSVDVLKLDCQGAEWQAFNDASDSVWQRCNEIVGEIHADLHVNHLLTFLTDRGRSTSQSNDAADLHPRDCAIRGVRAFAARHGFTTAFSLDDDDPNSAEFHAFRAGRIKRCGIVP